MARKADTRPKSESGWQKMKPPTVSARRAMLSKCGETCFLMPGGTPARPGVPGYPICVRLDQVGDSCVMSCPGTEAAYKRLRMGLVHYTYPPEIKKQMRAAAVRVKAMARRYADPRDATNTCNWALAGAPMEGGLEAMAKRRRKPSGRKGGRMRENECRQTRKGAVYCKRGGIVRFVPRGAAGYGTPFVAGPSPVFLPGMTGGGMRGALGRPMRAGECRRTRKGVKYCKTRKGVRFVRG